MNSKCKPPKCVYVEKTDKCQLPNAYIEHKAYCARKQIPSAQCKKDYDNDKALAEAKACERYAERIADGTTTAQVMQNVTNPISNVSAATASTSPKKSVIKGRTAKTAKTIQVLPQIPDNVSKNTAKNSQSPAATVANLVRTSPQATGSSQNSVVSQLLDPFETLDSRIAYYDLVQVHLKDTESKYCLIKNGDKYNIGDFLTLVKPIGTAGIYGVIYETVDNNNALTMVTKLMPSKVKENINEVRMNVFATEIIKRKLSKHFLMSYKTYECVGASNNNDLPEIIRNKNYYLVINELAHGDLKMLLMDNNFLSDKNIVFNVLVQCILSIATLHSHHLVHNDSHWGNFLFHLNKNYKKGYYHYMIQGKDFFLESCPFNMMIYDFGQTQNWTSLDENRALEDYRRVISFFMLKEHKSLSYPQFNGVIDTTLPIAKDLNALSLFSQGLHTKLFREHMASIEMKKENIVLDTIMNLLKNFKDQNNVLLDSLPAGAEILNETPYIIDESNSGLKEIPKLLKLSGK